MPLLHRDRARGALLGGAVGDALGMPVDGLSHQNVRTYYRGIKGYTADEKRGDLAAGQWTAHTQRAFALTRVLTDLAPAADHGWSQPLVDGLRRELAGIPLRRARMATGGLFDASWGDSAAVAACAAPLGVWAAATGASDEQLASVAHAALWPSSPWPSVPALMAAIGMARAVALALGGRKSGAGFFAAVRVTVDWAEDDFRTGVHTSKRLAGLQSHLDEFPLDLQDRCNGTGDRADEAFPFAVAMAARGPDLVEATLLAAVNVGGASSAVGAMTGALLGAFNGWSAFPAAWRDGLEDAAGLRRQTERLLDALGIEG